MTTIARESPRVGTLSLICRHYRDCLCAAIVIGTLSGAERSASATEAVDNADLIRAIVEASQHNRESFIHLRCTYSARFRMASSNEDALAGKLAADGGTHPATRLGIWIADGLRILTREYSNEEPKVLAFDAKTGMGTMSHDTDEFMGDGQYMLHNAPTFKAAGLVSSTNLPLDRSGPSYSPFAMGVTGEESFSPYVHVSRGLEKNACQYDGEEELLGLKVHVIRVTDKPTRRYSFASERGFACVRIELLDPAMHVIVTDLAACSAERWFPRRVVVISQPELPPGQLRHVTLIETNELDADYKAKDDDFQLSVPANTVIDDPFVTNARIRTDADLVMTIGSLPELHEKLIARARSINSNVVPRAAGDLPGTGGIVLVPTSTAGWWLVAVNMVAFGVLIAGAIVWIRRKRARGNRQV